MSGPRKIKSTQWRRNFPGDLKLRIKVFFVIGFLTFVGGGASAQESTDVKVEVLLKSTSTWDGGHLPLYPTAQPEVTIAKITIPPGKALPFHQHPVINAGCLIKGTLTVETDEKKTIRLKAGDPLIEVVGRWHRGKNEGTEPAEILVVYAGAVGTPITIPQK